MARVLVCVALACLAHAAFAQGAAPVIDIAALTAKQARRFPQPVRVGDLLGKDVLEPVESQPVLGHVSAVTHRPDGGLDMIMQYGGLLGVGSHTIAVPLEAAALIGPSVAIMDFTPEQLDRFPTVPAPAGATLTAGETIKMGLTRPFH